MRALSARPRAATLFICILWSGLHASGNAWAQAAQLDIWEYYVSGNTVLEPEAIAQACAPFLGAGRTADDVDRARAALEAAYRERGYKTVGVSIPQQTVKDGVVRLQVVESRVGQLNVVGSKYHSLERIKDQVPSLAEGEVPNFSAVERDIVAVNQQADRRVTPALKAGATPGTVDVDLVVDDDLPLHGSLELNNRQSQDTSELRAVASLQYDNLWQRGHSLSLSSQVAPEQMDDAKVFYGSYLARFSESSFSLMLNALRTDSDVSTVGGTDVIGNGTVIGLRGIWAFPASERFYSSVSFGVEYKRFKNRVSLDDDSFTTPVEYYPFSFGYTGVLRSGAATTQFDLGTRFAFSGWGSDNEVFGLNRAFARGQQFSMRASVDHRQPLFAGIEGRLALGGQITDQPLISNEQFSAGGFDSVRGYLEAEALGDSGWNATLELRSPSLIGPNDFIDDLRVYTFVDAAHLRLRDALPEQEDAYSLGSSGLGVDLRLWRQFNGSFIWARALRDGPASESGDSRWLFRTWASF
ncbi:ShlB/FhaC/HecB family hemolysin secretion/activation protein [Steroidobacter flavus]|uniref:ShlB/FhaC/HecB family hemolysin secretion/activation protein n=1 Tax=Steroidobacter flavus TaxID=1842136 RepID=A0ABV8T1R5_9GAMM